MPALSFLWCYVVAIACLARGFGLPHTTFVTSFSSTNGDANSQSLAARLHGLYVVTDARAAGGHEAIAHEAIARASLAGGARIVQLRDKTSTLAQLLPLANALRELAHGCGALFLVNDRVDLALACGADGVHLGPDDLPIGVARRLMPRGIIGASCGDVEEARRAQDEGADYIGAGAVFGTQTKADAGAPIGLQTLSAMVRATTLPVAAIGGIDKNNIASVLQAGARMVCVVSAISAMDDEAAMTQAARDLVAEMNNANESSTR